MEELRNIVKKKNKYSLEDSYHKACSDKDFYNYVKTLPIEEELLIKYTSSLEDCVKERKLCRNCPGIKECLLSVKGFVLTPEKNGKRVIFSYVPCSHKKEDLYKENIKYFDISRDVRDASLQNVYKDDKGRLPLIKYINDFIKNFDNEEVESKGLYLTGSFGSGKTYMVSAILNEMAKRGVKSTIVYFPEFLRDLKASFNDDFNEKFNTAQKSPILFIDDIGAENCSGWSRDEILGPILQYRMEEHLPTFFTSNLSLKELEEHLSNTVNGVEKVKARRIIERIKQLTVPMELISKNRRD